MDRVKVPSEVAEALDYHYDIWKSMPKDSINFMLMSIVFSTVHDKSLVLKEYAKKNPTKYMKAIVDGYVPEINIKKEVAGMLSDWLNKEYVCDEKTDIENFAELVTDYFKRQTL